MSQLTTPLLTQSAQDRPMRSHTHRAIVLLLGLGFILLNTGIVRAEDFPTLGIVYNTREMSSLVYDCKRDGKGLLRCEFTQMSVRKKAKPEDLPAKLKKARDEFRRGVDVRPDECQGMVEMTEMLEGRRQPPTEAGKQIFATMTEIEKRDLLRLANSATEYCRNKTEENWLKSVRVTHDRDARTCSVSSNTYEQTFKLVRDKASGASTWVAQGAPGGPCGIVQLSRFELARDGNFWNYIAKKAITNPRGSLMSGVSCKDLDESEYVYDWKSKEYSPRCDYIKFSPL